MTRWDTISGFVQGDDVLAARRKEDEGALAELDATPVWLDFVEHQYLERPDWVGADQTVDTLEAAVRAANPTAVFMPFGLANPDHTETHDAARVVRERVPEPAWFATRTRATSTSPACWRGGSRSSSGPGSGPRPRRPPSTTVRAVKQRALAHYESQFRALEADWQIGAKLAAPAPEQFWRLDAAPGGVGSACRRRHNRPTLLHRSCKPGGTACRASSRTSTRPSIGTVLRWSVAALMVGSGAIHFGMMGEHAGVSWTHGLFFATTGWLQIAFAALIIFRPTRPVIAAGIVLNLAILTVWVLTRTVGIAIGGDGTPEAWGKVDGLCAAFEGLAVIASAGLLSTSFSRRPLSSGVGFAGIGVVVLAIAVLTSLLFSPAAIDTSASASGLSPDGHNHGAAGASADGHNHTHTRRRRLAVVSSTPGTGSSSPAR